MLRQTAGLLTSMMGQLMAGDPGMAARMEAAAAASAAAAERAAAEATRRQNEVWKRLRGQLKLDTNFDGDAGGGLVLKGVDVDPGPTGSGGGGLELKLGDDGLKPLGTRAAANSGPPEGPPPNTDPMVVDLRDLQQASYMVGVAETAPPEDAPMLFDQALLAANGDKSFSGGAPAGISQGAPDGKGLQVFQMANRDYRKARDGRMQITEIFNEAQRQRTQANWMGREAIADLEKAKARLADAATLKEKQRLMVEVFAAQKAVDEAWAKARADLEVARVRENRAKEEAIRVLRANVARKDPATFQPPIPSVPSFSEKQWLQTQQRMISQRAALEQRTLGHQLALQESEVPKPTTWTHMREGTILGAATNAQKAKEQYKEPSAFTGMTPDEVNEADRLARESGKEGLGGAMVVSFGTPKTDTLPQVAQEVVRVGGDHMTDGSLSLSTPEGKQAVAELSGKSFDRLVAHSNGASVAEALIRKDLIRVNELNVIGGDRSLLNRPAFQQLVDSGKVKRVVVWIHYNDLVPMVSAPDQLLLKDNIAQRDTYALERIARKITGELEGGDSRVEYRFSWGEGDGRLLGPHDHESYKETIRAAYGTSRKEPKDAPGK